MPTDLQTAFRDAMSAFPSGVTIVTAKDAEGDPWGFTASAFSSVSMDPPLILVCLDNNADCYPAFRNATHFGVSILALGQEDIAKRFATKGIDKFGETAFEFSPAAAIHLVQDAVAHLECEMYAQHEAGDHVVLIGRVVTCARHDREPMVFYARGFWRMRQE